VGATVAVLAVAGWRRYDNRPRQRVIGREGLDEADVAHDFSRAAVLPPMRLLRWFVARRAISVTSRGEALDLGCGPGLLVIELARRAPDLHVTGIDLSERMVAAAQERARVQQASLRVSFSRADVLLVPLPDSSMDLLVSTLSLHHWSNPVAVLDEIARVLRPGGSFLVFDLRRDIAAPFWLLLWFVTRFVAPDALRRVQEPLRSRDAAYTAEEATHLARQSKLTGWRVSDGPLWLAIEGSTGRLPA
jgi:ubiquinone/menaquinone biosynthesis C-methylase UbiE